MAYKYEIFGFKVFSDIELKCYEADFRESEEDIRIVLSRVPETLQEPKTKIYTFEITPTECLFTIDEMARYYVRDGKEIAIELFAEDSREKVSLYLLGTAFGVVMMQRNIFPLHGSAVMYNGKCITLVGDSGAGKSSLASGFVKRGGKIISDDVSRFHFREGHYMIYPSYPSQKMWEDSAEKLGVSVDKELVIFNRENKFYIECEERFSRQEAPLSAFVYIDPQICENPHLETLSTAHKLNTLIQNTYRYNIVQLGSYTSNHFSQIAELTAKIPGYRLVRPKDAFTVDQQVDLIIEKLLI